MSVTTKVYRSFASSLDYKKNIVSSVSEAHTEFYPTSTGSNLALERDNEVKADRAYLRTQSSNLAKKLSIEVKLDSYHSQQNVDIESQNSNKNQMPQVLIELTKTFQPKLVESSKFNQQYQLGDESGLQLSVLSDVKQEYFSHSNLRSLRQNYFPQKDIKIIEENQFQSKTPLPPFTPKLESVKNFNRLSLSQTKSPQELQTCNNTDFEAKSILSTQFLNRNSVVRDLASELNQKQRKMSDLEDRLSTQKNNMNGLIAEHSRELRQKERQNAVLIDAKKILEGQIEQLGCQNSHLRGAITENAKQIQTLITKEQKLNQQILILSKSNEYLKEMIRTLNLNSQVKADDILLTEIKNQLNQKERHIFDLQRDNQSLIAELQSIKQSISTYSTPIYSLPGQGDFSVFEDAFKIYLSESQRYKQKIRQKDEQLQAIKTQFNVIRIENQRLKNELRIQEFRRLTQLRSNDTIMDVQRQSLMNQIKDIRHELSISKQRTRALCDEIKRKDQFIMKNIKPTK